MGLQKINELQDKLIEELQKLIFHLDKYQEKGWSMTFCKIQKMIENGDGYALDTLKRMMCGGMGSFLDLIIAQINGHKIDKSEEEFANEELRRLGNIVYNLTNELNRELNKNCT